MADHAQSPSFSLHKENMIREVLQQFTIDTDKLRFIAKEMQNEMISGLQQDSFSIKMIPSFVGSLPTGNETGTYLALDLGGTNFRVCAVTLLGNGKFTMDADKFTVPDEHKTGSGFSLFDFIADCVQNFVQKRRIATIEASPVPLGFTFSFPVKQTSINSGIIMNMSKGFECNEIVGQDVVELFQNCLLRKNVHVRVVALVNDTVGTLAAHSYVVPETAMGVILGTGTNAAYSEKIQAISKLSIPVKSNRMLINTEWGGFDNKKLVLPFTSFDLELDMDSTNPNQQMLEKMISGMYLGEVTRRVLLYLTKNGILFGGEIPKQLTIPYNFLTESMSQIEADVSPNLATVAETLQTYEITNVSSTDLHLVKAVVQQIGTRAARLSAMAIFSLLEQAGGLQGPTVVAIDGSVWLKYPNFSERLRSAAVELLGSERASLLRMDTAKDGSGVGAALIAAIVTSSL